jgi:hypothetical protein
LAPVTTATGAWFEVFMVKRIGAHTQGVP